MAEKYIRIGKISKIDYENGMAEVTYPDMDNAKDWRRSRSFAFIQWNGQWDYSRPILEYRKTSSCIR